MFRGIFKRSLTKYLSSYCLCLILPVVIFYLVYKFFFLSAYSEQVFAKTTENLENSFSSADVQMNKLHQIASQVLTSRQFSDSFFEETPRILTFFAARETLRIYRITNEFIYDIGVFDRESGNFYSSLYMLSLEHFIRFGPAYPEFDHFPFVETLFSAGDQMWIPETNVKLFNASYPLLTYISSYSNSFTHNNAVLVLLLQRDVFDNILRPVVPSNGSTAAVIDHTGQIIYYLNPSMNGRVEKFLGSGGAEIPGAGTLKADGTEYFSYVWKSSRGGLTYLSLIPRSELTGAIQKFTSTFFFMLLGILFCGSLLIFFLMRSNYKPIQKIVRYSREQGGLVPGMEEAGGGQRIGDIDLIQLTLENICKNNLNLEDRNKEYLRNGILFCLLKGTAPSDPAQFQKAGIDTGGVQHTVVIFRLDEDKVIPIDEFGRLLEKHLSPRSFKIYLLDYLEKNNFVGIFICHRESPHVRDILEKLCLETGREAGVEIKAAYGDEVRRIEEVSSSYFQARMVLRYQIQKSTRKTLGFQEMKRDIGAPANRNTILKYIEDHYQESEFCVQSVADHFGMSISNLSHQFKSYTGENIASRISVLRMHYAKELLTFTNRPVGEIAGQLGYFQPSSFIKKFKTTEGVTPGEYRISHLGGGVTPGGC